jgi:UDP-2-acetamido-3-amino-2,3-dideoxy-glucuronate N-acetyltransferase
MLVFDDTQAIDAKLVLYPHTINWKNGIPTPEKAESEAIGLSDHWEEPLKAECRSFLGAIATGQPPLTNGEEGLRVLKVLEHCHQSMEAKERRVPSASSLPAPHYYAHETTVIDEGVEIGAGAKIWHFSHVLSGSKIGERCNIGQNVVIGPDVAIGKNCKIQNNVSVYKGVTLEDGVFCGPSVVFTNIYNPRAEISKMDQVRPTLVKKGATLGANCTIVCGHVIGKYAFIGAGAVVTKDVSDHALMVGNPATQIGWMCKCGEKLPDDLICPVCKNRFKNGQSGLASS